MTQQMNPSIEELIRLKASLLSHGVSFEPDFFNKIGRPFYSNQFVYGQTSDKGTSVAGIPQLLLLGRDIVAALFRRTDTPWVLRHESDQILLEHLEGTTYCVELPERPPYFDKTLSTGQCAEHVIAVAGEDTPGFFFYPDCFYFEEGVPCRFCGMKKTRNTVGSKMTTSYSNALIREATDIFARAHWHPARQVSVTTGTCRTDQETRDEIIRPLAQMREVLGDEIPIHLLAAPPYDFSLLSEFRDAGVSTIAFNLEVFDQEAFTKICPGKQRFYGYDKWIDALWAARDLFGEYKVFCGLVWGLEAPESTIQGHRFFLENGVALASNVFHADPTCAMQNSKHPTVEDILAIVDEEAALFKRYPAARPIFDVSMRSTLDWEVHKMSKA